MVLFFKKGLLALPSDDTALRDQIEFLWQTRDTLDREAARRAIEAALDALDTGRLRVAEPTPAGWQTDARPGL